MFPLRPWVRSVLPIVFALGALSTACIPGSGDDATGSADASSEATTPAVTVPAERLTPFCEAMIAVGDRLTTDPPTDERAFIIDAYEAMVDEVPAEIRDDFLAVLAGLQAEGPSPLRAPASATSPAPPVSTAAPTAPVTGDTTLDTSVDTGPASSSTTPFFAEGHDPDEDPALRLNAYVQFACRDTQNNPGPPATEPTQYTVEEP